MIWLQGVSRFGAVPLYCGDGSTIPQGNSEAAVGEDGGTRPVNRKQGEANTKKKKNKLTFPGVSCSPL